MEFCDSCFNLYSSRIINNPKTPEKKLIEYYCKSCNQTKIRNNNEPVYIHDYGTASKVSINPNTPFDNTLPRIKTIACPNDNCQSHTYQENNVLMIQTSETHLRHIYICKYCKYSWKV
jgi:hypothetical protein